MGADHRGVRGGGTRDTWEEQVENRWFTLSLYPKGWREGSCWERRRDKNGKEYGRKETLIQAGGAGGGRKSIDMLLWCLRGERWCCWSDIAEPQSELQAAPPCLKTHFKLLFRSFFLNM